MTGGAQIGRIVGFARYMFRRTGPRTFGALALLLVGGLTEGVSVLLLIPLLTLLGPEYGALNTQIAIPVLSDLIPKGVALGLMPVLAIFVGLMVVQTLLSRWKSISMNALLVGFINGLRLDLFESIGKARWSRVAAIRSADLNHALTADVDRVNAAAFHLLSLIQSLVMLAIYLMVALAISPAMTLFAAALGAAVLAALQPIRARAAAYGEVWTERRKSQYRIVSEFLGGLKIAKSYNAEPRYFEALGSTLSDLGADQLSYVRASSVGQAVFQMATVLGLAGFVYLSLTVVELPLPQIIALIFVFMRLAPRFSSLQAYASEVLSNLPALAAMQAIQASCDAAREEQGPALGSAPDLNRALAFRNVSFSYGEDRAAALDGVGFELAAGKVTALVGPSGSGKSTIADLILGLLEPDQGTIEIDGAALDDATRRAWREKVAYVPQETFLLHDTIAANLALGAPGVDEAAMWRALAAANAEGFVRALPEGLMTVVGDRGARLSGGERQRIALARGILKAPRLLVLDEATSALDSENQALIAQALTALKRQMTILTIAHRPSMIAIADTAIIMDGGKVVETGSYKDLLKSRSGRLARTLASEQVEAAQGRA